MFKGTPSIGPGEFNKRVAAAGGRDNAFTSRDYTAYFQQVPKEKLEEMISLEADRMRHLNVAPKEFEQEIKVVMEERRMRTEDQPDGRAFEALFALSFVAHPYRWPVIGWRSDVEAATVEACQAFFDAYYVPNNVVVAIVGDFDADEALAAMREAFGGMPAAASIPRNPTLEPAQEGERRGDTKRPEPWGRHRLEV